MRLACLARNAMVIVLAAILAHRVDSFVVVFVAGLCAGLALDAIGREVFPPDGPLLGAKRGRRWRA